VYGDKTKRVLESLKKGSGNVPCWAKLSGIKRKHLEMEFHLNYLWPKETKALDFKQLV